MNQTHSKTVLRAAALAAACIAAHVAAAMPSVKDVSRARPVVAKVLKTLQSGGKSPGEVADALADYYSDAAGEAEKYLLYKAAIELYARAGRGGDADREWARLRREIPDLPRDDARRIAQTAVEWLGAGKAPQMDGYLNAALGNERFKEEIEAAKDALRQSPGEEERRTAMKRLAEAYAKAEDWRSAIKVFARMGLAAAKYELSPAEMPGFGLIRAADFWWDYAAADPAPYRRHAAGLYEKAIAAGVAPQGLARRMIADRIVEARKPQPPAAPSSAAPASVAETEDEDGEDDASVETGDAAAAEAPANRRVGEAERIRPAVRNGTDARGAGASRIAEPGIQPRQELYCVIDISGGVAAQRYPVSWLASAPPGGWPDEFKTTKIVLRRIEPGSCQTRAASSGGRGFPGRIKIDRPFYIGVFEITQKQYELVTGDRPSRRGGDMRPVEHVSCKDVRGSVSGAIVSRTFLFRLREKTSLDIDLPSADQWEYACRALSGGNFSFDGKESGLFMYARYYLDQDMAVSLESAADKAKRKADRRGGYSSCHTAVGSYLPNDWGLYDMHGNVAELCRDASGGEIARARNKPLLCGGSWRDGREGSVPKLYCSARQPVSVSERTDSSGVRIFFESFPPATRK